MFSPILKSLYDSLNETLIVRTRDGEYRGVLRSCDDCMNVQLDTEKGRVHLAGSRIECVVLSPEKAHAPYLR